MGASSYQPIMERMTWSFSRIETYNSCPYQFFLKYIVGASKVPLFYSSFGSFMHKLMERFYKGELKREDLVIEYLTGYQSNVKGERISEKVSTSYFEAGLRYLKSFTPFETDTIAVEKKVRFKVGDYPFVGILDYLGTCENGLFLIDHKSRDLRPRSTRLKPTKYDLLLDKMQEQLYLYCYAIEQKERLRPDYIGFNSFRTNKLIIEPYSQSKEDSTMERIERDVDYIIHTDDFHPVIDWFQCNHLCDVKDSCCYYDGGT